MQVLPDTLFHPDAGEIIHVMVNAFWESLKFQVPELKGKMGISISPANPNIVYIAIDALGEKAGVYRSEDAGESFKQRTNDATTYARSWYYMHIIADPSDEDEVWVMNSLSLECLFFPIFFFFFLLIF